MKRWIKCGWIVVVLLLQTGCWGKMELTELGFVMGIAIDMTEEEKILLNVQFYKPSEPSTKGAEGQQNIGGSSALVEATGNTLMEAIRDLPPRIGRKTQWSHMRIIAVSERVARQYDLRELLDFFYRDHEPRLTESILITEGEAKKYLEVEPLVEETLGQQLLRVQQFSYRFAGKGLKSTLLTLGIQMKGPVGHAAVSYVSKSDNAGKNRNVFPVTSLALLKDGKMIGKLGAHNVEGLLMLKDEYNGGIIEVPCPTQQKMLLTMESFETLKVRSRLKVFIADDISARVRVEIDGSLGELLCSKMRTVEEEKQWVKRAEATVKETVRDTIERLQAEKTDVIGIGNQIYARSPALWNKLKPEWEEIFAHMPFDVQVRIRLISTGTTGGRPALIPS